MKQFRYFDDNTNGFYYQHFGSQGWKKNSSKSKRPQEPISKLKQHSQNHNTTINSSTQTEQVKMTTVNTQVTFI